MEYMSLLLCSFGEERTEGLSLWRSHKHPSAPNESEQLLKMLLPHVQTALALRSKLNTAHSQNLFSETVMDSMSIASLLVDRHGRVHHMNRQAEAHLARENGLFVSNGHLRATASEDAAHLNRLLHNVTSSDAIDAVPGAAMHITRRSAPPLHVSLVRAPEDKTFDDLHRYAVVFLYDQSMPQGSRSAALRQLYRLTPAEARMADLLCSGLTIKDAAERCQVKLDTARFQVKQILSKTGVRRQTELMRLMLSLPGNA
jgi:DNA-binding CsgD family transcriptional regulator